MAEADPFKPAAADTSVAESRKAVRTKRLRLAAMLIIPALIVGGALIWWFGQPGEVSTDNAYVKQDIVSIAGEVQRPRRGSERPREPAGQGR
jgi:membrane fusion protein (multidrug efflux system)